MNTEAKLLPCPFCGSAARLDQRQTQSLWSSDEVWFSHVCCDECGTCGNDFCDDPNGEEAIEFWNRRAHPAPAAVFDERAAFNQWFATRVAELEAGMRENTLSTLRFAEEILFEGWQSRAALGRSDEVERLRKLSVTSIMLDITPGEDGMGHEVYAKSVDDVVLKISAMGERLEHLEIWHGGFRDLLRNIRPQLVSQAGIIAEIDAALSASAESSAPVRSVVMPERATPTVFFLQTRYERLAYNAGMIRGRNECLDEVAKLNGLKN